MIVIRYSEQALEQINEIISNKEIYNQYGHFTQQYVNWNYEYYRYINPYAMHEYCKIPKGFYSIGKLGTCEYNRILLQNDIIYEIIAFRFSKLPYTQQSEQNPYKIVGDAGYGYKIVQNTFNGKYAILTPKKTYLTKFVFDNIIGFHHSSNNYNTMYAVGFINNRAYAIYKDGNIQVLPYSKEQYLTMKHEYYESKQQKPNTVILKESQLRNIIRESIEKILSPEGWDPSYYKDGWDKLPKSEQEAIYKSYAKYARLCNHKPSMEDYGHYCLGIDVACGERDIKSPNPNY